MKITMTNQPRASGKTTTIKLMIAESFLKCRVQVPTILVLASQVHTLHMYEKWAKDLGFTLKTSMAQLRGTKGEDILIFIDEPFLMSVRDQEQLFCDADVLTQRSNISIHGIGTIIQDTKPPFERYL